MQFTMAQEAGKKAAEYVDQSTILVLIRLSGNNAIPVDFFLLLGFSVLYPIVFLQCFLKQAKRSTVVLEL